jgi:predicted nucleic acid-binding protein
MIVVADAGPLRYLIVIGHIGVLPSLFTRVLIPAAVQAELTHQQTPAAVRSWMTKAPAWLEVHESFQSTNPETALLDDGERQAISLALRVEADYILMDDEAGRRVASRLHCTVIGTIGILERAADQGLLDFTVAFAKLNATNFRMSPAFRRAILERSGEK